MLVRFRDFLSITAFASPITVAASLLARRGVFAFDASRPPVERVSTDRWQLPACEITRTRVPASDYDNVIEFVWSDGATRWFYLLGR